MNQLSIANDTTCFAGLRRFIHKASSPREVDFYRKTTSIACYGRFYLTVVWVLGSISTFCLSASADSPIAPRDLELFESKVRPILVEHCYSCHSAGAKKLRGGLLLDAKAGWVKGGDGGPAIVPGDPDSSPLVVAVRYEDEDMKMPPKGKLPADAIKTLEEWVKRGAPDPRTGPAAAPRPKREIDIEASKKTWAFQPLAKPDDPVVRDPSRCATFVDRFVLAKLEEKGIEPNPRASRPVLIRRASYDLIGLPPTPEEIKAFVNDPDPDRVAFEKVVDRLLESPRHGERWARHWLDLARFAESHGFEHDYDRPTAYTYRDFVIESINKDTPYDQFIKRQIAGDEIAPDDNLALKATGFLAAGVHSTQITANQVEKERYDELDDVVNTLGTAVLGLTVGCARCHDHKFDPIPQADYYRLLSTFTTTVRTEVDLIDDPRGFQRAKRLYDREHAPYLAALKRFEDERLAERMDAWEKLRGLRPPVQPRWTALDPSKMESKGGAKLSKHADLAIKIDGKNPDFDTYTIVAACDLPDITAIKIEALADPSLVKGGPGRAENGNFDLTDLKLTIGPRYGIGSTYTATLMNPKATFEQPGLPVKAAIDGDLKSGWAIDPKFGVDHAAVFEIGSDVHPNGGATLTITLDFQGNNRHAIGRLRISATDSPRPVGIGDDGTPREIAMILTTPRDARSVEQTKRALDWYKTIDPEWRTLKRAIDEHALTEPKPKGTKALISSEGLPAVRLHTQGADFLEKTHFLKRGDPNQKMWVAEQGFLQVLMRSPDQEKTWRIDPPKGSRTSFRRASLANWLFDVEQGAGSLAARVVVNRLWRHHMGRGIVATPSDFGAQGEKPTHPELLDRLAIELVRGGYRLKHIHKVIILSEAYARSTAIDPANRAIDPENALYWRRPRLRLEAEAIRDAMLAASGTIDYRMYGPGSLDERQKRRSVYLTVKRSKLIPMFTLFDAPDALSPIAARASTTVAPQSLFLLNSPIVRECAREFAKRVRPATDIKIESAVNSAYLIALGREPTATEHADAIAFVDRRAKASEAKNDKPPTSIDEALVDFCQVLFALNEFIYIE